MFPAYVQRFHRLDQQPDGHRSQALQTRYSMALRSGGYARKRLPVLLPAGQQRFDIATGRSAAHGYSRRGTRLSA